MRPNSLKAKALGAGALAGVLGCSASAWADPPIVGLQKTDLFQQTGPATLVGNGASFSAFASSASGQFDAATLAYPGSSSLTLPRVFGSSIDLFESSLAFPSQNTMDDAFPFGSYAFTLSNSGAMAATTERVTYSADYYPSAAPIVNAASLATLNHLDPSLTSTTVAFNGFDPVGPESDGVIFFLLVDTNGALTGMGGGNASEQSLTALYDLTPGESYAWELEFSDVITNTLTDGATTQLYFNYTTTGTGIALNTPEESIWAMMLAGFAGLGLAGWRTSRKAVGSID